MLSRIISLIVLCGICYIGFVWGQVLTENKEFDERQELKKEIEWREGQLKNATLEINNWKRLYQDKDAEVNDLRKENGGYIELLQKYSERYGPFKNNIEDIFKKEIIDLYCNQGKTISYIANVCRCGKSTIQRAVAKRGLKRGIGK